MLLLYSECGKESRGLENELLHSTICHSSIFMVTIFVSHIRPIMDFCSNVWNVGYLGDIRLLESVQQRWTREIVDVSQLAYEERLKVLELFSIYGKLLRADLVKCWKIFHSEVDICLLDGFTVSVDRRTRGYSFNVVVPRCELKMTFFHVRVIQQWNSLSEQAVMQPALLSFKREGSWIRNWVICCTLHCNFSAFFFFPFLLLCLFGSILIRVWAWADDGDLCGWRGKGLRIEWCRIWRITNQYFYFFCLLVVFVLFFCFSWLYPGRPQCALLPAAIAVYICCLTCRHAVAYCLCTLSSYSLTCWCCWGCKCKKSK